MMDNAKHRRTGRSRRPSKAMIDPKTAAEGVYAAIAGAHPDARLLALGRLAAETGDNSLHHYVQVKGGNRRPGRKEIDDSAALKRIEELKPDYPRQAVGKVALQVAGRGADEALRKRTEHRLRRKMREEKIKRTLCINPPGAAL